MSALRWFPLVVGLGLLAGCEPKDSDGDGLSDSEEEDLGSDPENADSDADGLADGAEIAAGTDPVLMDSDGDTYRDGDEMLEGTDPLDAESRIYTGYWPYNPNKETMVQNGLIDETMKLGKQFARVQAVDQFGETVDLYDFANEAGIPVLFDVSAEWCPPCQDIASFLDGDDDLYGLDEDEIEPCFLELRRKINQGELYYITVLGESFDGSTADVGTCERWFDEYPKDQIPILADEAWYGEVEADSIVEYVELEFWPSVYLLDSALKPKTNEADFVGAMCATCDLMGLPTDPTYGFCP